MEIIDPKVTINDLKEKFIKDIFVDKFTRKLDCLIITVKHNEFLKLNKSYFIKIMKKKSLIFDVKNILKNKDLKKIKILTL